MGEHPTAADTVGIRVRFNRYRSVIMGGLIAGIGGAYLTIGSVGAFSQDIPSGKGYIALAAMIFGRWTPLGAVGAALIFGFTDALQSILSTLNVPIPSNILLMAPYIAKSSPSHAWSATCARPRPTASPTSSSDQPLT